MNALPRLTISRHEVIEGRCYVCEEHGGHHACDLDQLLRAVCDGCVPFVAMAEIELSHAFLARPSLELRWLNP